MTDQARMYLRLGLFLLLVSALGVALYFLLFVRPPSVVPGEAPEETGISGGLPTAGDGSPNGGSVTGGGLPGGASALTPSPVANGGLTSSIVLTTSAIVSPQTSGRGVTYYDPNDGRFYRINAQGEVEAIEGLNYPGADRVAIAPDTNKAVVEFPDGANIIVDLANKTQQTLPAHWQEFYFSPDSSEIAAKSMPADVNNRALILTSSDGSTTSVVAALGENANKVHPSISPVKDIVAFSATGAGGTSFGQNTLYLVTPDGQARSSIVVNGSAFESIWAPNGSNFIYSVADSGDEYRPSLWYSDKRGDRQGAIRLRIPLKTTADKCVFADDSTLYCAVPREAPAGSGADASLFRGGDSLIKVSLPSGSTSTLAELVLETSMENLSLSPDGSSLYYTDRLGRLSVMKLR